GLRPSVNNNKQAQSLSNLVANHSEQTQLFFWLVRINRRWVVHSPMNGLCMLRILVSPGRILVQRNHIVKIIVPEILHMFLLLFDSSRSRFPSLPQLLTGAAVPAMYLRLLLQNFWSQSDLATSRPWGCANH